MIFLDTSAIYALADRDDQMHEQAVAMFETAQKSGQKFLVHSYIIVESAALMHKRLGIEPALAFLGDVNQFEVHWVSSETHAEAVNWLKDCGRSKISLVDAVSFCVMRKEKIARFLGFDQHFTAEGFEQLQ